VMVLFGQQDTVNNNFFLFSGLMWMFLVEEYTRKVTLPKQVFFSKLHI
jgi:hypothetical protein